ncbi:MAG: imidazoleglycerol-phosphate dehydratase [Thermoplasmata archaeon]|nr:imidazoleglycerol-phosphate dehydratase [Thermoplasmata archaeon]
MKSNLPRKCELSRKTRETEISLALNIDGSGKVDISLPDEFLRHMIETLAKYSSFDLRLRAKGDIEHHLIEDVAIALGKAFREAIGDRPIKRVAHAVVPMDEALVMVSVDLIDRPYMEVHVPDLMYEHFFRSFTMESRATIHSHVVRGKDDHHIIEATFKALGICLKDATRRREQVLSTKSDVEWKRKG